ncbi:conserved hypothetical protein [Listeria innocua FSL J1-023]|nr:conserved hypothetical protein [Listeria innocua FSL J1-023]
MDSSPSAKIDGDVLYELNQPFLDKAIQRGDDVAMATKSTVENLYIAETKLLVVNMNTYYNMVILMM